MLSSARAEMRTAGQGRAGARTRLSTSNGNKGETQKRQKCVQHKQFHIKISCFYFNFPPWECFLLLLVFQYTGNQADSISGNFGRNVVKYIRRKAQWPMAMGTGTPSHCSLTQQQRSESILLTSILQIHISKKSGGIEINSLFAGFCTLTSSQRSSLKRVQGDHLKHLSKRRTAEEDFPIHLFTQHKCFHDARKSILLNKGQLQSSHTNNTQLLSEG